ncbi:putative quinol monooxygenase [Paenibacillus sp. GCM10023252]|uniref:putative quinol monooxygenase n=1 Tax=Paenibacillus sp. GCM10023252 TaxID=3252649 RepID=UPI00361AB542
MIIIHAEFKVQGAQEQAFLSEIHSLIEASRAEEGNEAYDLYKDTEHPHVYKMVEVWQGEQAVAAHNSSEHFRAFVGKAAQFLAAPLSVKAYHGEPVPMQA